MADCIWAKEFVVFMKNKNLFFAISIIVIVLFGSVIMVQGNSQTNIKENIVLGGTQTVKMYVSGGSYVFEPSEFKKGAPVRIEADISRTPGCAKSIVIPDFGIRKTLTTSDNVISFTPDKAGTFNIACSMNMYKGTFTVVESDGTKSAYVDTSAPTGLSCGSGSGGCGCGSK
jgi:plastocyanin domain-containing protein